MNNFTADTSTTSLYVGNLHSKVDEAILTEFFGRIGSIASVRLCRGKETRKSLGYAFINYKEKADAERALKTLKFEMIRGNPINLLWAKDNPILRKPCGFGSIYVKNIDENTNLKKMHELFCQYGIVKDCRISKVDEQRITLIVNYENDTQAHTAIEALNGKLINGKRVGVEKYNPSRRNPLTDSNGRFMNIYINNFGASLKDHDLHELFSKYGRITSAKVMRDEKGHSRGFGFVRFDKIKSAERAIEEMNEKVVDGNTLYVGIAQKKEERRMELSQKFEGKKLEKQKRYKGMNLYVKNLSEDVDDARLRREFTPYGTIVSCRVMVDEQGRSKGFGFVCYSSVEEANAAVCEMNNRALGPRPLYVALAMSKEERRAEWEQLLSSGPQSRTESDSGGDSSRISSPRLLQDDYNSEDEDNGQSPKRRMIKRLASLVRLWQPDFASDILGLLLELYTSELEDMMANKKALRVKVDKLALGIQAQQIREALVKK